MYVYGVKDEMTSFLRLSERIEKNDLKIFDREYDIGCFIRFQYLFDELKYFVNKIKKDASFKRDILDTFKLVFLSKSSQHPEEGIVKLEDEGLSEKDLVLVRFFYEFFETSKELKIFFENSNIKEFDALLDEFKEFETFYKEKIGRMDASELPKL